MVSSTNFLFVNVNYTFNIKPKWCFKLAFFKTTEMILQLHVVKKKKKRYSVFVL